MDKTSTNWKACSVQMVILDVVAKKRFLLMLPFSKILPKVLNSPAILSQPQKSFKFCKFTSIECNLFIVIMDQSFLPSEPCSKSYLKKETKNGSIVQSPVVCK